MSDNLFLKPFDNFWTLVCRNERDGLLFRRMASVLLVAIAMGVMVGLMLAPHDLRAAGRIHYVAPTGVDSASCTVSNPCRTIQQAITNTATGDEIRVAAGTYNQVNTLGTYPQVVYLNKSVTLMGGFTTANWVTPDPVANPTIIDAGDGGRGIHVPNAVVATVSGFQIRNCHTSGTPGAGVYNEAGTLTLEGNWIYSNSTDDWGGGVANGLLDGSATLYLMGNDIYSNDALIGGGVLVLGGTAVMDADAIYENTATDVGLGGGIAVASGSVAIRNALIYGNSGVIGAGGIHVDGGSVDVRHVTLYDNSSGIIATNGTAAIANTLILSNTGAAIFKESAATLTVNSTDFFGNGSLGITPADYGSGNVTTRDPQLVSPLGSDFHLKSTSPVIDTGTPFFVATEDFEGNGRPFGGAVDRGAYEYTSASTCYARLNAGRVYTNVQAAVDASTRTTDVVKVAGTCSGVSLRGGVTQTVYLSKSLTLRGGYLATDWTAPSANATTILNPQSLGRALYIAYTPVVTVENMHFTQGQADRGGGVLVGSGVTATFYNNVFYGSTATGDGGGLYIVDGKTTLQHNTFYNNSAAQGGAVAAGTVSTTQVLVRNNVVASNTGDGFYEGASGQFTLGYNNVYGNTGSNYGNVSPGSNDISVPPAFANAAAGNFHLGLTSALINAADPASPVPADFEGDPRPVRAGSRADLGADERLIYAEVRLSDAPPHTIADKAEILGKVITFTHTLTNVGNTQSHTDTFNIALTNSQGWVITLTNVTNPVALARDASVTFNVLVKVPYSIAEDAVYNATVITATSGTSTAAFDTTADIIAKPGADFTPDYTANVDPGNLITYTHVLTNQSGGPDTFELSLVSSFGWGQLITPTGLVTLNHGESVEVIATATVANTAMAGLEDVTRITARSTVFGFSVMVTDTTTANPVSGDRYVLSTGSDTNNNCTQKATPCATISYAVDQAAWADTVHIAGGLYSVGGILINQNVNLRGGYEPGNWSNFDPAVYPTVIDAQGSDRVLRVLLGSSVRPTIEYLTLKNGVTSGVGGAVYLQSGSSPTLTHLTILDSSASHGGAIYVTSGSPILQDILIQNTSASLVNGTGGAIYVGSGAPQLEDVRIYGAQAASGAGLYSASGDVKVYQSRIISATASGPGGGVYIGGGTMVISQTYLGENGATAGGGLYNGGGTLAVANAFIYSNTATTGGGGGVASTGALTSLNNTFYGNQAATEGGGILSTGSSALSVVNTIVASNMAATGGGLYHTGSGGATLDYNDVWGNTAGTFADSNVATGAHSISTDPGFVDPASGDLHLSFDSPCVDMADPDTTLTADIDEDLRPANQGFDIGADEVADCLVRNVRTEEIYGVLQTAIDLAVPSDELQISGICRGVQPRVVEDQVITQTVFISQQLTLSGGYNSSFSNNPLMDEYPTILDARGLGRVVVISGTIDPDVPVILSRLTLLGGDATNQGGGPNGSDAGGAFYNHDDVVLMKGCVISESHAALGGGMYNAGGQLTLMPDSAIAMRLGGNTAVAAGGGLYLAGGTAKLGGVTFEQNDAFEGGALYQAESTTTVTGTHFYSNTATSGAGIYYGGDGPLTVESSTFMGNTASNGAALFNDTTAGTLELVNSLVVSNTATSGNGGGLYNASCGLDLRHATFYGNSAGSRGGAIYDGCATAGAAVVNSSLLINNVAASGGHAIYANAADPDFDYNDVYPLAGGYGGTLASSDGTGNVALDPLFVSLEPSVEDFLHLLEGTPVRDIADPASPVTVDFDGEPRPSDQGFDMGADELGGCYIRINGEGPIYGNVQLAINRSSAGDTLHIAGTCRGTNAFVDDGKTVNQTAFLTKSLTLQGGYSFELNEWSTSDPVEYPTTLNAQGMGRVAYITNTAVITLDGLSLREGTATEGGALFVGKGTLNLSRALVYSNTATYGGALYNQAGTVNFVRGEGMTTTLHSNTAQRGGAVYNGGGTLTLDSAIVSDNQATQYGGAFYHAGGTSFVQNTIIRDNAAATYGGGVYHAGNGSLTVWHNTFYKNEATQGGGIYTTAPLTAVNNVFFDEAPTTVGYAIYSTVAFTPDYNDAYATSGTAYGGSATAGTHSLSVDPLFVDAGAGDFHLQLNSPVIDKGNPTVTLLHDFEGEMRPGDQGFDMGADEIPSCLAWNVRTSQVYGNVQTAINVSAPGDVIWVTSDRPCRGVHSLDGLNQTVHITHSLTLIGGYEVNEVGAFVVSDPFVPTVLDAQNLGRALLITNTSGVTLTHFTLQNGSAVGLGGKPGGGDGGGVFYYHGSGALLTDVRFFTGTATYGGAIFDAGSGLAIAEGEVATSTATLGGGIYNVNDTLSLTGNELFNNLASDGGTTGSGGALYNETGILSLQSNLIHDNQAEQNGGGFYNANSASVLDVGNRFYRNQALIGNGGGLYSANGSLKLYNTVFYLNSTYNQGGGVYLGGGANTLYHNTFYGNEATQGTGQGGGVFIGGGASAVIKNTIFYWNDAPSGGGAVYGANGTLDYNAYRFNGDVPLLGGVSFGANDLVDVEPHFIAEADDSNNCHLNYTSPLIDQAEATPVTKDMDGDPRPVNATSDIGADEYRACLAKLVSNGEIYGSIQEAFNHSDPDYSALGDLIQVHGVCEEGVTLSHQIAVHGGYDEEFERRDTSDPSVINALGRSRVITATGPYVSLSAIAVISGSTTADGGGIWSSATQLNLADVIVAECASTGGSGGGVYVSGGTVNMNDTWIYENTANVDGGGLCLSSNVTATLDTVDIDENDAVRDGGGMYTGNNSTARIVYGGMLYNTAGADGGGMYNAPGSSIDISGGSAIALNQARVGGGVYNDSATFILAQKQINQNTATTGAGGGMYADGTSVLNLVNLGMYANESALNGGGLYKSGSTPAEIYHATINANASGGSGGGIYNTGSTMVVSATIVVDNVAPSGGSGIQGDSPVQIAYNIHWNNAYGGTVTGASSNVNPQLRDVAGNLLYNSPAIDAVPSLESHVPIDRVDDERPQLCAKDIGRDEYLVGERLMQWTINPSLLGSTLVPGEVVTYLFGLTNNSTWQVPIDAGGVPGTGYTETLKLDLTSTLGYGEFVTVSGGGVILPSGKTITAAIGPGETLTMEVRVEIPAGAMASVEDDDSTKEFTYIDYSLLGECANYEGPPFTPMTSNKVPTLVAQDVNFVIEPANTGVARPGESVTYTHVITNLGNITDTYLIYPQAGYYGFGEIITPTSGELSGMAPGMTATLVMRVTINEEAAKGLTDRTSVIAQSSVDGSQTAAADSTVISPTSGIRYVALSGTNSFVDETLGSPDPDAIDYPDNNCTQPSVGACRTLQHAITQAEPGEEIRIAGGVYPDAEGVLQGGSMVTQTAYISKPLVLRGGYEIADWVTDPPDHLAHTTTLSPTVGRALYITGSVAVTLDRLDLAGGDATDFGGGPSGADAGGALYSNGADLTLHAVRIRDSVADVGGGLYSTGGDLLIQNSLFHGDQALATNGGALYIASGTATLQNNTFYMNTAAGSGGAVYVSPGTLVMTNTIFANNTSGSGAAAQAASGTGNYNLYHGNTPANVSGITDGNALTADPLFEAPADEPPLLSLQVGSPAKDSGSPATTLDIDYANSARPLGLTYDRGAYERVPVYNLLFYPNTVTSTLPGTQVVLTHTLENIGDTADAFVITASQTQAWPVTFEQPLPFTVTVGAGLSRVIPVTITVPGSALGQMSVVITATSASAPELFASVTDTILVKSSAWAISKQVTPVGPVLPGDYLTYTLTMTNVGELPTGTTRYTITDQLPAHTTYVSASPAPSLTSPVVTWSSTTSVASGQAITRAFTVRVTKPLTDGTQIVNGTYAVTGGGAPATVSGAPITVAVSAPADLQITKQATPALAVPGDYLTYTLTITNAASAFGPATSVVISDSLPAEVTYQSMGFVSPATGTTQTVGSQLRWLVNSLPVGGVIQVQAVGRVASPLAGGTLLTDTYRVTAANDATGQSGQLLTPVTVNNVITLSKTVEPLVVAAEEPVTYTVTLTNTGNGIAQVSLTDLLAPGFIPGTYTTNVAVPGRTWTTTEGVAVVTFNATAPMTAGVYANQVVTASYDATESVITNVAPVTVYVPDKPIVGLDAINDSPTALGDVTTLTATVTAGTNITYTWDFGDGTTGEGAVVTHTYPAAGTYTAVITANNTINALTDTTTVVVDEVITGLEATNDSPTAVGTATTLTATVATGTNVTYTWDFGDGTTGSGAVTNHIYSLGIYTAVVTATNSVSVLTDTTTVVISDEILSLTATNDGPTALGSVTTLTATAVGGVGITYVWDFGDGTTGSGAVTGYTYPAVGTYTAVVTASTALNTLTATTTVVVQEAVADLVATNDSPTILGGTTTLTATLTAGTDVTYVWDFGDGMTGGGSAVLGHAYPAGMYTAVVTASNLVSTATATTTVYVDSLITGLTATSDSPTALGAATTFTAVMAGGTNVTYVWDFGDGTLGSGETTGHTYLAEGTYTAVVTATNSVSFFTATTTVTVQEAITGLTVTTDSPTVLGTPTMMTATVTGGTGVTVVWDLGDGTTASGTEVTYTYPTAGTYTVVVTASNEVSVFVETTTVSVDEVITGLTASNDSPTVWGNTTTLTATTTAGTNISYAWDFGDGMTGGGSAVIGHAYEVGVYTAVVTATNSVSVLTATTVVTVTDAPITALTATNDSPTEVGSTTTLTATMTGGSNVSYVWDFGDGSSGAGLVDSHIYPAVGTYTAIVTATNPVSSMSATTTVTIVDVPIAGLAVTHDAPTALGDATTFTATVTAGTNVLYSWDFGDGTTGSGAVTAYTYPLPGTYTVVVTATNGVSTQVVTATVLVEAAVSGLTATNDSPTELGQPTTVTATVTGGSNVVYTWDFGDGTTGSGAVLVHTYPAVGTYTAVVTANNSVSSDVTTTVVTIVDVPVSGLTATNDSPTELGQVTALTATVTGGSNVVYTWDFGDGTTGSGAVLAHTYPAVGTYTALVTASNGMNALVATTPVTITDVPVGGVTVATSSPTALTNATTFTVTAASGSNLLYTWDFGDGSPLATGTLTSGTPLVLTYAYPVAGTYTAVVTVSNSANSLVFTTTVEVIVVTPISGLVAVNDSETDLGSPTTLTATVATGSDITYDWAFGDGTTGTGAVVTHVYPAAGTYTAVVTASNLLHSFTATTTVTIVAPTYSIYLPLVMRDYRITEGPDLVATSIDLTSVSGGYLISVTVRNLGTQPVAYGNNFYVDLYVDQLPAYQLRGDVVWGVQGSWFTVGATRILTATYALSPGSHQLYAQVDTDNTVVEGNETNNVYGPRPFAASGILGADGWMTPEPTPVEMPQGPRPTPTLMP